MQPKLTIRLNLIYFAFALCLQAVALLMSIGLLTFANNPKFSSIKGFVIPLIVRYIFWFTVMGFALYFIIRFTKQYIQLLKHSHTILEIHTSGIVSTFLGHTQTIFWGDILSINVQSRTNLLSKQYPFLPEMECAFLEIYTKTVSTPIYIPFALFDGISRSTARCTSMSAKKLYRVLLHDFSEKLYQYNISVTLAS